MYIDSHAHLNLDDFRNDADTVIQSALSEDTWMINAGINYKSSRKALDLANRYEKGIYAAVGLHPSNLFDYTDDDGTKYLAEDFNYDVYEKLGQFEKAIAIGEVGLDYYHLNPSITPREQKQRQKEVQWEQLRLARNLDLPVLIHCRQAHDDMIALLTDFRREFINLIPKGKPWAVMHCFSGTEDLAWQYFNLGLIVSFTGLVTFSQRFDDLIRRLPPDKFMIETDCPFMTPEPFRGQRNEPQYVKYVAKRIGEIRNVSTERIAELSTKTAQKFFGL